MCFYTRTIPTDAETPEARAAELRDMIRYVKTLIEKNQEQLRELEDNLSRTETEIRSKDKNQISIDDIIGGDPK